MNPWFHLSLAILSEVIATSTLKKTEGFTRLIPSLITVIGYGAAFYFLSQTLRDIPVGIAYAIWSGVGIVLIAGIGWIVFDQKLDLPSGLGLTFIVGGVVILNVFSDFSPY